MIVVTENTVGLSLFALKVLKVVFSCLDSETCCVMFRSICKQILGWCLKLGNNCFFSLLVLNVSFSFRRQWVYVILAVFCCQNCYAQR